VSKGLALDISKVSATQKVGNQVYNHPQCQTSSGVVHVSISGFCQNFSNGVIQTNLHKAVSNLKIGSIKLLFAICLVFIS
jgi:hypothetical protein